MSTNAFVARRRGRLGAALLLLGILAWVSACGDDQTAPAAATPSAQQSPAPAGTGGGGPVKVWVRDVQGPPGPYVSELAGVLFRSSPDTSWPGQGLGGFGVVVQGDPFWTVQYVQQPDPHWKQSQGLFPYVLPEVLTVPPGRYTLRLWLGTRLIPSTRSEYRWGANASRWIPGESYVEGAAFLGFCETTVVVEDAHGVTVRVWFPEFPRSEMDFTTPCPTG